MATLVVKEKGKGKGKQKQKRYAVRYDGPADPVTGVRKQLQKSFETRKEASDFMSRITLNEQFPLNPLAMPMPEQKKEILFGDYARNWFEVEYYQKVRATTFKSRRYYLEKHVLPFFEEKLLSTITAEDVKEFYAGLKKKYADKTISTIHKFLSTLFYSAIEAGYLAEHPSVSMKKTKSIPKDPIRIANPWSYPEMIQFLDVAEQEGKDVMFHFELFTGVRQGELLAFPWFDIDLEQKTITVTRSISYDEAGNPELIPKSQDSYRTFHIPETLVEKLKKHKEKQDDMKKRFGDQYQHDLDLVFPVHHGGFQNPSNVRRLFYGLIKKAKLRRITFHDLRHTHASMLIRNGESPTIVQKRLGHDSVETTFKYYGHLWANADEGAVQKLEAEMNKHKSLLNGKKPL